MANKSKKKIKQKTKSLDLESDNKMIKTKDLNFRTSLYAYITIVLFGFILYANTINHDYALDDAIVVTKNGFTQEGISGISDIFKYDTFTGFWLSSSPGKTAEQIQEEKKLVAGGRYRPLSLVSFALEIEYFGKDIHDHTGNLLYKGNPRLSHINNIILYIVTSLVLFIILKRFFPNNKNRKWYLSLPFLISMIFLAHPIHTEAVANIKGRDEIMTLLGSLLALWFTIKYLDTNKFYYLIISSLSLFLGLLSKENAITFLAIIPISIYYFTKHSLSKNFKALLPLLLASGIFLLIRASILGFGGGEKEIAKEIMNNPFIHASFGEKYATIFYTLWMYIRLLFFPHPLTYDYYPHQIEIIGWSSPQAFLPLLLYIILGVYAVYGLIKKKDIFSYAIWFYILPLSVVSNIFFPVGTFMNERFVFISSIGFAIFIAYIIYQYVPSIIKDEKSSNYLISLLFIVILSLYSVKTISRNRAWENDLSLFTTDVKTSFNSAKSTCSAGGKLLEEAQKPYIIENKALHDEYCETAIAYLERSIEIYPEYVDALNLLGNAHFQYNFNVAKSLYYYTEVLKHRPFHSVAINNSKIIAVNAQGLLNSGQLQNYDEILVSIINLLEKRPEHAEGHHLAGNIYGRFKNDLENAIIHLEKARSLNLNTPQFYRDLGVSYGLMQKFDKALECFLKAIEIDPIDVQTYYNVAVTYMQLGNALESNKYFAIYNEKKKTE